MTNYLKSYRGGGMEADKKKQNIYILIVIKKKKRKNNGEMVIRVTFSLTRESVVRFWEIIELLTRWWKKLLPLSNTNV